MLQGKAENAGGLTPTKDDNAAQCHLDPELLSGVSVKDFRIRSAPQEGATPGPEKRKFFEAKN